MKRKVTIAHVEEHYTLWSRPSDKQTKLCATNDLSAAQLKQLKHQLDQLAKKQAAARLIGSKRAEIMAQPFGD